jgi:DNA-directed RNA polymerase specialized sigma24 family protein
MSSTDILPAGTLAVGGLRHVLVLDLISSLESAEEEDLFRMALHGWTQAQIAGELGVDQSTVSRRLKRLIGRAAGHHGSCDSRCHQNA